MLFQRLFRCLVSLLLTLSSLPASIATGPSGAYERIGPIYQTYRIAIATWGVDQKKILSGLADAVTGTHAKGGANFREMINYLDGSNIGEDWFMEEDIDLDDPDPHKTTIALYYRGDENTNLLTLEKVCAGENPSMPSTLAKIRTILKDAHQKMEEKGKLDEIKPFRDRLDECHIQILNFRQSEMEGGPNGKKGASKDIKKKWPDAKVVVDKIPWEHLSDFELYRINAKETVAQSPSGTFVVKEVDDWVRDYGKNEGDTNAAKKHFNVLKEHRATMDMERFLIKNVSC